MMRPVQIMLAFSPLFIDSAILLAQPNSDPNLPTSTPADSSLEHGLRLLSNVRDNVLSFDDPAFYWFCRYVTTPQGARTLEGATGSLSASESTSNPTHADGITPIKFLLERPNDYRGRPVVIEGTLVAKWSWTVNNRDVPNPLHQCEIAVPGTRALAAVITTEPVDDIPIRSYVRVKGYFIKIRAFQTTNGESGFGPLLVAKKLNSVDSPVPTAGSSGAGMANYIKFSILTMTALAAVIWLILRRAVRRTSTSATNRPRPVSATNTEAADDFDWMLKEPKD